MRRYLNSVVVGTAISTAVLFSLTGCSGSGTGLPTTTAITVVAEDGTEMVVQADQGSGAQSLKNSTWQFFRTENGVEGAAFLDIPFGPDGELVQFDNNTIAPEILGTTVLFDGMRHATGSALEYAAATFGAESSDETGFTFQAQLNVFAPVLGLVGTGSATATGTRDPADPDTMTGTFSFSFQILVSQGLLEAAGFTLSEEDLNDSFTFTARRTG